MFSNTFSGAPDLSRPASSGDLQRTGLAANYQFEGISEQIICKPSGGGTGKSRTKPLNHQLGDVRLKVLSMS
jgi:hypothetical protein